ncbi:MAG: family 16 glycosylhydrolase [Flavobacteriales bacterium]|nr:family 16 glycosylhydrolase [Flavobacteriales bacterium]
MRKSGLFLLLFLAALGSKAQCDVLVWADEFESNQLSSDNWTYEIGDGCPQLCGWGNNELQYYTDSDQNTVLENGELKIRAVYDENSQTPYTSARLISKDKVSFTSGKVEARIKMPIGQGMWPAFWLLPNDNDYGIWPLSGEIDITEMVGFEPSTTHGTIHYGGMWPNNVFTGESATLTLGTLNDNFHTYAVEWDEGEIRWYIDDALYSVKTTNDLGTFPWSFDQEFYIILNLAIGGNWPGYPDESTSFPQEMVVDYVRVYQGPTTGFIRGEDFLSSPGVADYSAPRIQNATFNWTIENGTIISGEGTSDIELEWANADDHSISCQIIDGDCDYSLSKDVVIPNDCTILLTDFEDQRELHWATFTGDFDEENLISPNEVNSSARCGKYMRSTTEASGLGMTLRGWNSSEELETEQVYFTTKVLTNAPVGSTLFLYLEDQLQTNFPGTSGRRIGVTATTTVQYEWEELVFNVVGNPNENITEEDINFLRFVPIVSENQNFSFYLDDISLKGTGCLPSNIESSVRENVSIWSVEGGFHIEAPINGEMSVTDLSGRTVLKTSVEQGNQFFTLPSGGYLITFSASPTSSITSKVIVQ